MNAPALECKTRTSAKTQYAHERVIRYLFSEELNSHPSVDAAFKARLDNVPWPEAVGGKNWREYIMHECAVESERQISETQSLITLVSHGKRYGLYTEVMDFKDFLMLHPHKEVMVDDDLFVEGVRHYTLYF